VDINTDHKAAAPFTTRLPARRVPRRAVELLPLLLPPLPHVRVQCLLVRLRTTTTLTPTSNSTGPGTLLSCPTLASTVPTPGQAETTYLPHASRIGSERDLVDCGKDLRVGIVPVPQHVVVTSAFRVCLPVVLDRSTLGTSYLSCGPRRMRWTRAPFSFYLSLGLCFVRVFIHGCMEFLRTRKCSFFLHLCPIVLRCTSHFFPFACLITYLPSSTIQPSSPSNSVP
jgi:hypothetical protein